jgi:hypothetical protein
VIFTDVTPEQFRTLLARANGTVSIQQLAQSAAMDLPRALSTVQLGLAWVFRVAEVDRPSCDITPLELCRLPTSPYRLPRHYWSNSVSVRRALSRFEAALQTSQAFWRYLRELHVCYLMGDALDSFYIPASHSRRMLLNAGTTPGAIRMVPVDCPLADDLALKHIRLLAQRFNDRYARSDEVSFRDDDGLLWGYAACGPCTDDAGGDGAHVFWPAEQVLPPHLDRVWNSARRAYAAATRGERQTMLPAVADFLRRFICLHPFITGNMGLVMNIVNWLLRAGAGGYVCHVHLDWCAHRLEGPAFECVFERFVDRYLLDPQDSHAPVALSERIAAIRQALETLRTGERVGSDPQVMGCSLATALLLQ